MGNDPFGQLGQTWAASVEMWSSMLGAWQSMLQHKGLPTAQAMVGQFADPAAWPGSLAPLMQELLDILALPRFADLPGLEPGKIPSPAPALELLAIAQQYMLAAAPVWAAAFQRFQSALAERYKSGVPDNAGEVLDVWNNALDQTLMAFNRSNDFAKLQQRYLQAAMRHRIEIRKLGEQVAEAIDMPTRTEMTDVYRRLHDLHREVHRLRRELREARAKQGAEP